MTRQDDDHTTPLDGYLGTFGERYADAIRAADDAPAAAAAPRHRSRRLLPAVGLGGVVAAGAIAYAVVASPVGERIDVVQRASAALGNGGDIVHYATVIDESSPNEGIPADCTSVGSIAEVWQTASGRTRWHEVMPGRPVPEDCAEWAQGPDGRPQTGTFEVAQDGGDQQLYFHDLRLLMTSHRKETEASKKTGATVVGGTVGGDSRDFVASLRDMLKAGKMRVVGGEHQAYGHDALSIEARSTTHKDGDPEHPNTHPNLDMTNITTFVVDAKTFTPLHLNQTDIYVRDAGKYKGTVKNSYGLRFTTYERLPRTPETEALLSIHPDGPTRDRIPESEKTAAMQKQDREIAAYEKKHPLQK